MKKMLFFLLAMVFVLTSCSGKPLLQFSELTEGEKIAIVKTSKGDFKLRLFPEQAPLATENFIALAESGYYNNITFHRVIRDFVIQGGDPTASGYGGESIWQEPFKNEVSAKLHHFRGALCMANAGADTNSSQFYIVQGAPLNKETLINMEDPKRPYTTDAGTGRRLSYGEAIFTEAYKKYKPLFSKQVLDKYAEVGGQPQLDYGYTIFGHVFEGMEVVDQIASVSTDERSRKPFEDVMIESVTITEYTAAVQ